MNKEEKKQMKSIIKPLIKECLTEVLVEQGLIKVIQEHNLRENIQPEEKKRLIPEGKPLIKGLQKESAELKKQAIQEVKNIASFSGFDPFAGTEDIDTMESKAQEGVNVDKLFDENMINSWNQQLELIEGKRK